MVKLPFPSLPPYGMKISGTLMLFHQAQRDPLTALDARTLLEDNFIVIAENVGSSLVAENPYAIIFIFTFFPEGMTVVE